MQNQLSIKPIAQIRAVAVVRSVIWNEMIFISTFFIRFLNLLIKLRNRNYQTNLILVVIIFLCALLATFQLSLKHLLICALNKLFLSEYKNNIPNLFSCAAIAVTL